MPDLIDGALLVAEEDESTLPESDNELGLL